MRKRFLDLILALTLGLAPASGQELTLRERAALADDILNVGIGRDTSSPELSVLANEADLIVQGQILTPRSYLSDDGMLIYSDYVVQVRRVSPVLFRN